ncbi:MULTISPECIES: hypothetical protein [unclassified Mesorhizobium]|uniref:hypothetical protein n=1 Tax=unclassified Mesorhizobium TaxID=325217 RepID=UPI0003CE31D7|nr:hypothetical protein [Mesorhizobium sp. LSHC420B00]ESX71598.1 hypothetical protein X759_21305 [Mesorhizobium sp. LSHC420B00]
MFDLAIDSKLRLRLISTAPMQRSIKLRLKLESLYRVTIVSFGCSGELAMEKVLARPLASLSLREGNRT